MKGIIITPAVADKCRRLFITEHQKFASKSMLLSSDLDKPFTYNEHTYDIVGMWINEDPMIEIIIKDENKNHFRLGHRAVANMMGFQRYRNRVTEIEMEEDHSKKKLRSLKEE